MFEVRDCVDIHISLISSKIPTKTSFPRFVWSFVRLRLLSQSQPAFTCETHFTNPPCVSPFAAERRVHPCTQTPPSLPPFSPPRRSLWKIIGVHWEHYWFSLAMLRNKKKKSELYLFQNTDQRGKNWPCFKGPFTSNLCLFSFYFLPPTPALSTCPLLPVFPPLCSPRLYSLLVSLLFVYVVSFSLLPPHTDCFYSMFLFCSPLLSQHHIWLSSVCFVRLASGSVHRAGHTRPHAPLL